jgi:hypothetical protein
MLLMRQSARHPSNEVEFIKTLGTPSTPSQQLIASGQRGLSKFRLLKLTPVSRSIA